MAGYQGTSTRRDQSEFLAALPESERGEINTTAVGTVVSYDTKTQTATVQPKLAMNIGGQAIRAPELMSVPVQHARAGGTIIHKPLKKGDEVTLHFSQRPLDEAIEDGKDQPNNRGRMNSLSDAVAVPTAHSKGKQLANLPSDRMHIGTEDGKSGFQMKEDGAFDIVRNGDSLFKLLMDLTAAFRDHMNGSSDNSKKAEAQAIFERADKMVAK